METKERCLQLCRHIETLTGVHTTVLDVGMKQFLQPPFHDTCALYPNGCNAFLTHLYGAYESERWDGKYIYYCPRGLVFIATPPMFSGQAMEYCLITGPILMMNTDEDVFEDALENADDLPHVPRLTTAQARALSELIASAVASFALETVVPDVDSGRQAVMLQRMYDFTDESEPRSYPIDNERRLQEHIRSGDKEAAQELLNELLVHIYYTANGDLSVIKARVRELLVLMNRAAIDGGADVDEIMDLCYRYELEVESLDGIESVNRLIGAVLHKFISFVFDLNDIKHQNVVFQTTAYIKAHLTEKLSLDEVAEHVYLSKSYFCRIIKDELGCTFTEYVNRLRVERSKILLTGTGMPIAEIACAVGFDDQSYFNRIFKKQTGIAPGSYRKKGSKK
ncbi:MAG: helix-turn-helix domain-containing protein [Butyricicoccus sp.]|nr:helix-turn-helix domain-containing protein [Butyricicoccus sp.]